MRDPHRKGFRKEVCRFVCNRFPSLFHRLSPSALWIHCPAVLRVVPACLAALAGTVGLAVEARTQDLDSDRQALIALYNATDGEDWANNENWLSDEPLGEWQGVTVSDGRVTELDLSGNELAGPIPPELGDLSSLRSLTLRANQLTGGIPPELGNLSDLTILTLFNNQLTGGIAPELGDLSNLEKLWLAGNRLTGPIPPELGNLSSLWSLDLSNNQLAGPIPPELGNLSSLWSLDLSNNQLAGPIPPELGKLSRLRWLDLAFNGLTGSIPVELGNLSSLESLELNVNHLTGPIPPELGKLSRLRWLDLAANQLTGPIPPELGKLSRLESLSLRFNQLTGPIPPELGDLSSLRVLILAGNRLTGPIPSELGKLSLLDVLNLSANRLKGPIPPELGKLSRLESLELNVNHLTGPIPPELGKLSRLESLSLRFNQLTGPIPPELGDLSNLEKLWLAGNRLTGPIPPELGNLSSLTDLTLSDNRLTGAIPSELGNLSSLGLLILAGNRLTGPIPPELGDLSSLGLLILAGNRLTGPIPPELGDLSSLRVLILAGNRLTGPIPSELGKLSLLDVLNLSANRLKGPIPPELGDLSSLGLLNLASNRLEGPVPPEMGNLASLEELNLASNRLSGPIPPELGNLSFRQELGGPLSFRGLFLANNQLTGPIPPELGNLVGLDALDLSDNQLTGPIPPELGNLSFRGYGLGAVALFFGGSLDLSGNQLTGPIPPELGDLSNLGQLYLSDNRLTGPIPPEIGNLSDLWRLNLSDNQLTGPIPPEMGNLSSLRSLHLANNQLTGPIPESFTNLTLEHFYFYGNPGLSVPVDMALREWLGGIGELRDQDYSPSTPFVPVILSAGGRNKSFYTSELTLTNRGTVAAYLSLVYTAHIGEGSGVAYGIRLYPGEQRIIPNAINYVMGGGYRGGLISFSFSAIDPLKSGGNRGTTMLATEDRIGTLRVKFAEFSSSDVAVTVRTTTPVPEGRAGLAYSAIPAEGGFGDEAVYLCGLRQNEQDRSNLAFQNMGESEDGAITLRTTVFSGDADGGDPRVLEDVTLAPGGFHQYSGLLERAGFTQGYARVERVSGTAPFYAYGVINDQANSDGSFVSPVRESALAGTTGQTLPVIVETNVFTSELMVTNFSDVPKTVTFRFRAEAVQTPDKAAVVEWTFQPGQQVMVPNLVEMMRKIGTPGIGPSGQTFAGALFATVAEGDMSGIAIGARTSSPGGVGRYGVFYKAVPSGEAFDESAWVVGLQQNVENRSNLALINTGEVDGSPSVFQLDIYDGVPSADFSSGVYYPTGMLVNTVTGLRVPARGWRQINSILAGYAPETTQGYVRITKISGNNPFLAYGVINDGGTPGQRSGDGAYLPARP